MHQHQIPLSCFDCCCQRCRYLTMSTILIWCRSIFSQPYCGRSIHGFRTVCTYQMWPYTQYIYRINGQVLASYCALETRGSEVSIDTSEMNGVNESTYSQQGKRNQDIISTYSSTNWTPASIFSLVGSFLHRTCYQTVGTKQMPFEPLIRKKSKLTFLTVQWRPIVDHFWVDLLIHGRVFFC